MSERAPRAVRSFVLRTGRMTPAQERALAELLPERRIERVPARGQQRDAWPYRRPLHLEIGSGNGENALALAAARPDVEVLAAEVHPPGIGHMLLECERRGLTNLRVYDGDVIELLDSLPPGALDSVYIYFPDPWPKKRHHKRRLVQAPLLDLLVTRCQSHARVNFASDDADYALAVRALIDSTPGWFNLAGPAAWAPRPRQRIVTRFELRARRAGRAVHDLAFAPMPA